MKRSEFNELVSLAEALTFISESELFHSVCKEKVDNFSVCHNLFRNCLSLIGDAIKSNLIA